MFTPHWKKKNQKNNMLIAASSLKEVKRPEFAL